MQLNGCHNKPRPDPSKRLVVQDGWVTTTSGFDSVTRWPRWRLIPNVMSVECQYTLTTPDPRCAGCVHENKTEGEQK